MPNDIISEYACKKLFFKIIDKEEKILRITKDKINEITVNSSWLNNKLVCKVDQEIKHRKNNNLVIINKDFKECLDWILTLTKDYDNFIIATRKPVIVTILDKKNQRVNSSIIVGIMTIIKIKN